MDFQQQQQHGYMRPPPPPPPPQQQPPSMPADPYYHHQGQRPPLPSPNPWYSTQFQFQHASSSPQPPPPPPPHAQGPPHPQWAPTPQHSDQFVPPHHPYPVHPPPYSAPYPAPPNQYPLPPPPSHPSLPPRPPHMPVASPHISQPYPHVNQDWGPASWDHYQSWEYLANNNEEVWAAKARAWAASKVASDDQQSQHPAYAFKDGSIVGDSTTVFAGRDSSISSSAHQQEVPSSYSSVAGDPRRGTEHLAAVPDYTFVPSAEPALVYPPVPVMLPAGSQVDPVVPVPSPAPGHSAPIFGRMPGPNFQPAVSSVAAPFGMGAGSELHPGAPFSGDSFGVAIASERPKKASVPNWLREEIIKNKPVIVSSATDLAKEDVESTEDDSGKGDQKSIDSRSTEEEEEEDDEDDLEAARTAAINHEIKRIVTDVLLQVTAELFDEIATKVLSEDDPTIEDRSTVPNSTLNIANTEVSSTVSFPLPSKETISSNASKNFDSSRGDVLGLASYASDDEDSELDSSDKAGSKNKNLQQQSTSSKLSKGQDLVVDSGSKEKANKVIDKPESELGSSGQNGWTVNDNAVIIELKDEANTSNEESGVVDDRVLNHVDNSKFNNNQGAKNGGKSETQVENHISRKSVVDDYPSEGSRDKLDKNVRHELEKNLADKNNNIKELEISKESVHQRGGERHNRHDEGHIKKERRDEDTGSKGRGRDKVLKSSERAKDSDSRKRLSPDYVHEGRRERQTESRASLKEENDGKRVKTKDDRREKPRDRDSSEANRHSKRHASSASNRDRDHRDGGHASDSSDESSDDSKRKPHSRRRRSPSPVRSRKRHVSRSPHSKHSQRRHSPYSSLETSRGKKSRSRSPSRRKR